MVGARGWSRTARRAGCGGVRGDIDAVGWHPAYGLLAGCQDRAGGEFSGENRCGPITAIRVRPRRGAGLTEGGRNTERGFAGGRTGV